MILQKPSIEKCAKRVIHDIKLFVTNNKRIPIKRELQGTYKIARKSFGTWNKAIEAAGYISTPVIFSSRHTALDGHVCDSVSERIIDDWLFKNGIEHEVHVPYPGQKRLTADFLIDSIWVEFFGIYGVSKKYTASADRKIRLALESNLDLVKVFPSDLFPVNKMKNLLFATEPNLIMENVHKSL